MLQRILILLALLFVSTVTVAANFDYQLKPLKIADNVYAFIGATEDFSFENGGNIVNTGFIVTSAGVVVIDSGPSLRYGQQMRAAIKSVTDKKINRVYLTHHHPDHFLGNQAFEGVPIYALKATATNIKNEGAAFADNLYVMVGDWMRGTDVVGPNAVVEPGVVKVGNHQLEMLSLSGHTSSDLAIFDHTSGVLFSGDLIFHKRTLTTPHADIKKWLATIQTLKSLPFKTLVPGHGPISDDKNVLIEMTGYLNWLDKTLKKASEQGLAMTDVMALKLPEEFSSNALLKQEFSRSVIHLYSSYEAAVFKRVN